MEKTEIYIAVGDEKSQLSDADWQSFLKEIVTPRFSMGYSVLSGQGQWFNATLSRDQQLAIRVIVILHDGGADASLKINEIRSLWKQRYPCESVMRVDSQVEVAF